MKKEGKKIIESNKTQWTLRENGTYNPRHNDRRFDLENSEHIDAGRVRENIYWDCYRGYTTMQNREEDSQDISFEKIECTFYQEHYGKYIEAQNE